MIERCTYRHFDDLAPHQQHDMLALLTGTHQTTEPEKLPQFGLNGGRPVALLKDGKVIAAMITDENHNILHWAGRMDREFQKEIGHSPALAIMRAHLAEQKNGKITFVGQSSDAATNLVYNKFFVKGQTTLSKEGDISIITFTTDLTEKLEPKIQCDPRVWRPYALK